MLLDTDICRLLEIYRTNIKINYWTQDQILLKSDSKKVFHEACEFLGNKITSKNVKKLETDEHSRYIEKIIIQPGIEFIIC